MAKFLFHFYIRIHVIHLCFCWTDVKCIFLDQKFLQATVVKLYWQIKAQINLKKKRKRNQPQEKKLLKNPTITWRLNNALLKNQWINEETKREIKNTLRPNDNENTTIQNFMRCSKSSS